MLAQRASFGETRILVEQLRLLLGNVGYSVIPTIVLAIVLSWILRTDENAWAMDLWAISVVSYKLFNAWHARYCLKNVNLSGRPVQLVWTLIALNALDGLIWGGLPWVTLDTADVAGTVLVIAVMAGVTSNAMSVLSPVLPVFVAFCFFALAAIAVKLWLMSEPAYQTLAGISLMFVATLIAQARTATIAARSAISLRFENIDLIDRLRNESANAQAAHKIAHQANLAKSKFLAAASHDLRQPIHALGLFLEVIGRSSLSRTQSEMLDNARASARASSEMLNTLLDFSRIEAGVVHPQPQPFGLQSILNKIESEFAPQAVAKGLVYRTRETSLAAISDPLLVEIILRNLVSNAIRYTDHGGVLVACRCRNKSVVVQVWDTGVGIHEIDQSEIFREFHQLGNPERDRNKGLGLGLAIVDGLVKTLGVELSVRSEPGKGSAFQLVLPQESGSFNGYPPENTPLPKSFPARVLLIEDDEAIRTGMTQLLEGWGCTCVAVDSIDAALASARKQIPDIIISDYRLPEQRTGSQAIVALRKEFGQDLPALLVTGDTAPERLREAQSSGVPLLHKPVHPSTLFAKLVSILL